jgi:hypothetical protein
MILTDDRGRPFRTVSREDFAPGIAGDIEWMRTVCEVRDRVANEANRAFAEGFTNELKRHERRRAA